MLLNAVLTVVLVCGTVCNGQQIHFGKCKNYTTQSDFDVEKFFGDWYDIEKFFFAGQMNKRCVSATYYPRQDGGIDILNQDITEDNHYENTTGVGYSTDPNSKSKLTIQLQGSPKVAYWILDTDYVNYSLIWSCTDLVAGSSADFCWILSRKRSLDQSTISMLKAKLQNLGIAADGFHITNQNNCD